VLFHRCPPSARVRFQRSPARRGPPSLAAASDLPGALVDLDDSGKVWLPLDALVLLVRRAVP
jgi:hypothetical protein